MPAPATAPALAGRTVCSPAPRPGSAPVPAPSPLADAYARLAAVFPGLKVTEVGPGEQLPRGAGWVTAEELAADGAALDAYLARDDDQVLRDHGRRARPDVIAGFGLHRYAWPACLLVTLPWFLTRRVPLLAAPAGVAHHRTLGRMAVRTAGFACLPDDPAAGAPGAWVVPDEEALRAEVRQSLAEHLEPLLVAFGPRMRRRGRALWGMVTDEIAEGLWYVGHLLGEESRAVRDLGLLLPGATGTASAADTAPAAGTPGTTAAGTAGAARSGAGTDGAGGAATTGAYAAGAAFRTLHGSAGQAHTTRDRASCCLYYTLRPQDTCVTCPRTCDAERIARLDAAQQS